MFWFQAKQQRNKAKISIYSRRLTKKKKKFVPNNVLIPEIVGENWKKAKVEVWLIFYTTALIIPRYCTGQNILVQAVNVTQAP